MKLSIIMYNFTRGHAELYIRTNYLSDFLGRQILTQDGLKIFINWPEIECYFTQKVNLVIEI